MRPGGQSAALPSLGDLFVGQPLIRSESHNIVIRETGGGHQRVNRLDAGVHVFGKHPAALLCGSDRASDHRRFLPPFGFFPANQRDGLENLRRSGNLMALSMLPTPEGAKNVPFFRWKEAGGYCQPRERSRPPDLSDSDPASALPHRKRKKASLNREAFSKIETRCARYWTWVRQCWTPEMKPTSGGNSRYPVLG